MFGGHFSNILKKYLHILEQYQRTLGTYTEILETDPHTLRGAPGYDSREDPSSTHSGSLIVRQPQPRVERVHAFPCSQLCCAPVTTLASQYQTCQPQCHFLNLVSLHTPNPRKCGPAPTPPYKYIPGPGPSPCGTEVGVECESTFPRAQQTQVGPGPKQAGLKWSLGPSAPQSHMEPCNGSV